MPTPTKGPRLGGSPAHERLILANLATSLFEHGGITTTVAKAKRLRPLAERLVTFAKKGDLSARRRVLRTVRDKSVVHTLFTEIGPRYDNRNGGYTRITKLGPRKGDNAPMARIELVEAVTAAQSVVGEAERSRGTQFAESRPVGARTQESAEDLASESATAASVAATGAAIPNAGAEEDVPESSAPSVDVPTEGDTDASGTVAEPTENAAGDVVQDLTGGDLTGEASDAGSDDEGSVDQAGDENETSEGTS